MQLPTKNIFHFRYAYINSEFRGVESVRKNNLSR